MGNLKGDSRIKSERIVREHSTAKRPWTQQRNADCPTQKRVGNNSNRRA